MEIILLPQETNSSFLENKTFRKEPDVRESKQEVTKMSSLY